MPKVSVCLPTYNRARYLPKTVSGILAQTYQDFELLICNDASSDNTEDVIRSFSDKRICRVDNFRHLKIPEILNHLIRTSSGEYIIILHDHDEFNPLLLEKMVHVLDKTPRAGFVHVGIAFIDDDGSKYRVVSPNFPPISKGKAIIDAILLSDSFSCPLTASAMVRRSAYESVGFRYDPRFGFASDIDMWLRISAGFDVAFINDPLIVARRRDSKHEFSGVNWHLLKWLADIHKINIERNFMVGNPRRDHALAALKEKIKRRARENVIVAFIRGDYEALLESKSFIDQDSGFLIRLLRLVISYPILFRVLNAMMNKLNRFRISLVGIK